MSNTSNTYEKPEAKILLIAPNDVITLSGGENSGEWDTDTKNFIL